LSNFHLLKMNIVKKLLVPFDFSTSASAALRRAVQLAAEPETTIHLLHVADVPTIMNSNSDVAGFDEMQAIKEKEIVGELNSVLKNLIPGGAIKTVVLFSPSVGKAIAAYALEKKIDLILMGMKGTSPLKVLLLGSNTRYLLSHASCPVLAIPLEEEGKPFRRIVYASDFETSDAACIQQLIGFAQATDAEITVLHVFPFEAPTDQIELWQQNVLKEVSYGRLDFAAVVSTDIEEGIMSYLASSQSDLLVLYEKEFANLFERLFHTDHAKLLATHAQLPVLCFNKSCIQKSGFMTI